MLAILLAVLALLGTPSQPLILVDDSGAPVARASVVFVDSSGARDVERTNAAGEAVAALSAPVRATVSAPGFASAEVDLATAQQRFVLQRALPLIGSVRVATGAIQNLHSLPVAASLLDAAAIAHNSAATGDALLRQLPGFDRNRSNSAFTNYGQLRVSFSGSGNDRGLMLVDGVPAQDGFGGQVDWAAYPPSTVSRAELLRGAGSALYGAGAVGGVLELQTFGPTADTQAANGTLSFTAGTHDLNESSINVRTPLTPRLSASLSVDERRLSYFDFPPSFQSNVDEIATSHSRMTALRFRYGFDAGSSLDVAMRGAWDEQQQGRPNYTFSRRLNQGEARYRRSTVRSFFQATAFTRGGFVVNVADQYPAKPGVLRYVQNVPTIESGEGIEWSVDSPRGTFELRADARGIRGENDQYAPSGALQSFGRGSQQLTGFALQQTFRSDRTQIVLGARADRARFFDARLTGSPVPPDRTDEAVSPRIAIRYDASQRLAVRASIGSGFRPPYLNELVRGFFIGNVSYGPNPRLIPERSSTGSAGLDWTDGKQRWSLDAFDTRVNDAIMFRTIDATHQQRSNVARTQTDGATLTYARELGTCSRLSLWATDQNARVTGGPGAILGKRLQYVPNASAGLSVDTHAGTVGLGFTASYLGQTYADDLNAQPLGTAVLAGLNVRVPLANGARIDLNAENLTGARYLSSVDRYGPPAVISISVHLPIASPGSQAEQGTACDAKQPASGRNESK